MRPQLKTLLDGFNKAAENSAAFDRFYYHFFSLDRVEYGDIPRPALWANNVKASRWIPKLKVFIFYAWKYFSFIFFFLQVLKLIFRRIFFINVKKPEVESKIVAIGVCQRSIDVIGKSYLKDKSQYLWLLPPGVNLDLDVDEGCCLSSSVRLSLLDLFFVFYFACRIHIKIASMGDKSKTFQTYSIVSWLVLFVSLIRLKPETVVTSEHHDRWAVLVDTYCEYVKTLGVDKISFVMVQHGSEFFSTYEKLKDIGYCDGLPCRIRNVTDIFVYDSLQLDIFRGNILESSSAPDVFFYQYCLTLSPVFDDRKKILIVGNSFCESFHIQFYNQFSSNEDFLWFYKPHPVQKPSRAVLMVGWNVVEDNSFFPKVDLVISYPSTLASEYRLAGIDVLEHGIACDEVDFNTITNRVNLLNTDNM